MVKRTKILIVGDSATGKSALIRRLIENKFELGHQMSFGASFVPYEFQHEDGTKENIELWDMAGENRQKSLLKVYYSRAKGIMITIDMSERETFENIQAWVNRINDFKEEYTNVLLVGTKMDEKLEVSEDEAKEYAESVGYPIIFTSSFTGSNVREAFTEVLKVKEIPKQVVEQPKKKSILPIIVVVSLLVLVLGVILYLL